MNEIPTHDTATRLSELMHESSDQLTPDTSGLIREVMTRGHARRRRTAVATMAATAGVVGVVAAAAVVGPGLSSAPLPIPEPQPAALRTTTPTPIKPATPTIPVKQTVVIPPNVHPRPVIPREIPVRAIELPEMFGKLHPGTVTITADNPIADVGYGSRALSQTATFLWNGYLTTVSFAPFDGTPLNRCKRSLDGRIPMTCVQRLDGSVLMTWTDKDAEQPSRVAQSVSLLTNGGYEIEVISYNTPGRTGAVLSEEPPFSIAQLTKDVTSSFWPTHR